MTVTAAVISDNYAFNGSGLFNDAEFVDSSVSLIDSVVTGNGSGSYAGGGIFNYTIQGKGVVNISDSQILSNTAFLGGGIFSFGFTLTRTRLTIAESIISGNTARNVAGIINSNGLLTMTQVFLVANAAEGHCGGLCVDDGGVVLLERSTICGNTADDDGNGTGDGGGIYNSLAKVSLVDSTVCGNTAATFGGGIFSSGVVTATRSQFNDNIADDGGALFIEQNATNSAATTIVSSTLGQNIARQSAGAINNSGLLAISASTFSSNTAQQFSGGAILNNGVTTLANVTFSGNSAGGFGGALRNLDTLTMTNVTITGNDGAAGSGIYNDQDAWLVNTIIAGNIASNCDGNPLTSLGHNLEDADTCNLDPALDDLINTNPLLSALSDNGGPTLTHALPPESPAIDSGDNAVCPATDQRGVVRPLDGDVDGQSVCDIGAFEYQISTTTTILSDAPDPSEPYEPFTVTVSVTAALGTPTGAVTVTVSGEPQNCTTILAGGVGACSLALSLPGTYTLTATYSGDSSFATSLDTQDHTVTLAPTTTSILSDEPDPSEPSEPFTVTVSVSSTLGTPTGAVTVTVSGEPESCSTMLVSGMGGCALVLLAPGTYTLTASYGGDGLYAPSNASEAHSVEMSEYQLFLPAVLRDQ